MSCPGDAFAFASALGPGQKELGLGQISPIKYYRGCCRRNMYGWVEGLPVRDGSFPEPGARPECSCETGVDGSI